MTLEKLISFYEENAEPCFVTDSELNIIYFNQSAKNAFPAICSENGMDLLIALNERQGFKALIDLMGSSKFMGYDPAFSNFCFYITAVKDEGYVITPCHDNKETELSPYPNKTAEITDTVENLLRTDLSAVFSVLPSLKDRIDPSDNPILDVISQSSYRVFRTATNLLDYTRLTDRNFSLNRSVFSLTEMLKNTAEIITSLGDKSGVKITLSLPEKPINVFWDYNYILSAVVQLVSNAIKFSVSGSKVHISLKEEGENVLISINDSGLGMPTEVLKNCTAPFYSYNFDGKTCNSAGLGLTIATLIANHHSGALSITSKQKNGTEVKLSIPAGLDTATEVKSSIEPMPDATTIMVKLADCLRIPLDF